MSQESKTRFQQMRENDLAAKGTELLSSEQYAGPGHARNLCFVWPDGRRAFLNYSYLVAAEYLPEDGAIRLTYTTHMVELKGIRLENLYDELMDYIPRMIVCVDKRYDAANEGEDTPLVHDITITNL